MAKNSILRDIFSVSVGVAAAVFVAGSAAVALNNDFNSASMAAETANMFAAAIGAGAAFGVGTWCFSSMMRQHDLKGTFIPVLAGLVLAVGGGTYGYDMAAGNLDKTQSEPASEQQISVMQTDSTSFYTLS